MSYRIVVGVDGSPHGTSALRWAMTDAATRKDAKVIAVLAWQMPLVSNPTAFDPEELQANYEELLVQTVADAPHQPGVPVETRVISGEPIDVLVEESRDAQLLVVGSRGKSLFKGVLLGSVSQACAARAVCPVVVVKQPHPENSAANSDTAGNSVLASILTRPVD
jgi:nucleotide-binding universal stress UspA family protein